MKKKKKNKRWQEKENKGNDYLIFRKRELENLQ